MLGGIMEQSGIKINKTEKFFRDVEKTVGKRFVLGGGLNWGVIIKLVEPMSDPGEWWAEFPLGGIFPVFPVTRVYEVED
jgi:hypothetical protein